MTTYTCPMHPEIQRPQPGICPKCGMTLVPVKQKVEHDAGRGHSAHGEHAAHETGGQGKIDFNKHAGHSTNVFKTKFWVSLALSVPVVLYSPIVTEVFHFQAPVFPGSTYIPAVLASVIFFYGGWVFLSSAIRELRAKLPGMMTLISLAIITAYLYSVYSLLSGGQETLFWELSTLITIMLLGHWMEMRAVSGAQGALKELSKLLPDQAEVLRGGETVMVALSELKVGDLVLVKPGGKIPADGVVAQGNSEVNEAVVTGESRPVNKTAGAPVIAGTINGDGSLQIKVTQIGENTFLAGVMRLVTEAQASKSKLQVLSDRAAFLLTVVAVVAGVITLVVWIIVAQPSVAVERMVAVLVIACPHALGLAIPLVASISTTKAAQNGFLVKQRLSLEAARLVDMVLFDKTGTLTTGAFGVDTVLAVMAGQEDQVLSQAASVNSQSEHPLAQAMVTAASQKKLKTTFPTEFKRLAGKGAQAQLGGKLVTVGNETLVEDRHVKIEPKIQAAVQQLAAQGKTVIYVMEEERLLGAIALADQIRPESRAAVQALRAAGIKTAMITGDSQDVAKWVSGELGLDEFFARVLPDQKAARVKELQAQGLKVAMVGDGVNDAPALTQADLGIAIGAGTNVAIESAGIILVKNDPRDIPKVIRLSQLTYNKMIQNLFWATGYNVVAIPLAAGVLVSRGIDLQPAVAAVLMSLSTVIVALNALLLKRKSI